MHCHRNSIECTVTVVLRFADADRILAHIGEKQVGILPVTPKCAIGWIALLPNINYDPAICLFFHAVWCWHGRFASPRPTTVI